MATTAVIAGTATVTSNAVNNHAQRKAQEQAQAAANQQYVDEHTAMEAQQASQPQPAAGGGMSGDMVAELGRLADLKAAGALSEEEFQAAKAKLLQ
jgi:hypothetical protein